MQPYNDSRELHPQAYINTGAICWMNSLIQSLLAVPQFCAEIAAINDYIATEYSQRDLRGTSLAIVAAFHPNDAQMPMRVLRALIAISAKSSQLSALAQQCPDEGLHMLFDAINDRDLTLAFETRYDSCVKCGICGAIGDITKNAANIVIDVEFRSDSPDFATAIMHPELANAAYRCEKCGKTGPATIKYDLRMANECIIIRVRNNNVGGAFGLSREYVKYPASFALPSYNGPKKYNLRAIIVHNGVQRAMRAGNMLSFESSGHYTANVYNGKWYTCNDSTIYETNNFMSPAAYLLFYNVDV